MSKNGDKNKFKLGDLGKTCYAENFNPKMNDVRI